MISKWLSQVKRLNIFLAFDRRKIGVPSCLQGQNFLLFDYWYANTIISAEKEGLQFIFQTRYRTYKVDACLLDSAGQAIAEDLTRQRPRLT